jgi:hypothetical protein
MAQQTAVEWFINNIPGRFRNAILNTCSKEIDQANKMFEQQIETAYNKGTINGIDYPESKLALTGEQYYTQTYEKSE